MVILDGAFSSLIFIKKITTMKYINLIIALAFILFTITSCDKEEDDDHNHQHMSGTEYDYHAHIHSPNSDAKHMGDQMDIDVVFESHKGETVHHINVKIQNASDASLVTYNQPNEAHIHETDGKYEFSDQITLSEELGFSGHSDWLLIASVWGHDGTEDRLERDTIAFHVHP